MAGLYVFAGPNYMLVVAAQIVAGGLGALLVVLTGRELLGSLAPSILAGCMYACHPLLIFATDLLYPETLYLPILLLFTLSCPRTVRGARPVLWATLSGLLLGLSVLMKPNLLLFPLPLLLWLWYALGNWRQALIRGALIALVMLAVVAPWAVRNYGVSGSVVPVSTNLGQNLWQGIHPEAKPGEGYPISLVDPLPGYSEVERDRTYRAWAVQQILADPGRFIGLIPLKIAKFFSMLQTTNQGRLLERWGPLIDGAWAVFLGVAVWGAIRTLGRSREWGLVYLLILYPVGVAAVFYGATRFSMVTYPYLFLLAAGPIYDLATRLWQRSRFARAAT